MKNIFKILKMMNAEDHRFIPIVILYSLVGGLLPVVNVVMPKYIFAELLGEVRIDILIIMVGITILSNVINQIINQAATNYFFVSTEGFWMKLRYYLVDKSLRLPVDISESKDSQDDLEKATSAASSLFPLTQVLQFVFSSLITLMTSIIILGGFSIALPIVLIILGFFNYPIIKRLAKLEYDNTNLSQPSERAYSYFLDFSRDFKYAKDIKIFDAKDLILDKAKYYMDKIIDVRHIYYTKNGIYVGFSNIISQIQIIISFIYMSIKYLDGLLSPDDMVMYFNAVLRIQQALQRINENLSSLITININLTFVFDYLEQEEGFLDRGDIFDIDLSDVKIRFEDVSFKYPSGDKEILKNCSFEINSKETVALVGKNGAGKSTIVKLICKFYEPTRGNIYLNDINIKDINTRYYYQILSVTFQDFRLLPFRISENVSAKNLYDIDEIDRLKMDESFEVLNIANWIDNLVEKEDTFITTNYDSKGIEPSGGIGQKIALARSMYHEGKFIIMDEPTSALDPRSEQEIFENMLEITENQTSLFISHRLSSTRYADKIIVCEDGYIKEEGTHDELMNNDKLYAKMFRTQSKLYE